MSEEELRNLEQNYLTSDSEEDLNLYNELRRKMGLNLVRINNFVDSWKDIIAALCTHPIDSESPSWRFVEGVERYRGGLTVRGYPICATLEMVYEWFLDPRASTQIASDPKQTLLITLRAGFNQDERAQSPCFTETLCYSDNRLHNSPLRILGEDKKAKTIWKGHKYYDNNFLTAEEFFTDLVENFCRGLDYQWSQTKNLIARDPSFINVNEYLFQAKRLNRNVFKDPRPIKVLMATDWFKDCARTYAQDVEKSVESDGLYFDMEQTWPISFHGYSEGMDLKLVTGYADTVELTEEDQEKLDQDVDADIDANDYIEEQHQKRGYVSRVLAEFTGHLENYDTKNKLWAYDAWECDYELEEFSGRYQEISYEITATRKLDLMYLIHIVQIKQT